MVRVHTFELLGGIAILAVLLALAGLVLVLADRRSAAPGPALTYLPLAVLAVVLGLTGAGAVTYADSDTQHFSVFLLASVATPVVLGSVYAGRREDLDWMAAANATAMAWGLPYVLGMVATFALTVLPIAVLDPAETGTPMGPFLWAAALGGGATTVVGTLALLRYIAPRMRPAT